MVFKELFRSEKFSKVFEEVNEFADVLMCDYNKLLPETIKYQRDKEIFDAIWGNIEFSAGEICILDSPLLQRLRKIKQLGLAHCVYCGCDYSRFYHTIGVVFLADKMARSINKALLSQMNEEQKSYFRQVVRIAALFHDVGHMFMSHVSEHYFGKSPLYNRSKEVQDLIEDFHRKSGTKASLHELISCMIVNTEAVSELFRATGDLFKTISLNNENGYDKFIDYISCLIVGVPLNRDILPYSKIINGPIDADKCDYLSRDSYVTRVPVAVDMSRLTQKMSVVEVGSIYLSDLWNDTQSEGLGYFEMAVLDSAEKTLFQLSIARTMMFDSVYYHHKVLTAETEFRSLIHGLSSLGIHLFDRFSDILRITDNDFSDVFFNDLQQRHPKKVKEISRLQKKAARIYNRNLDKRVACFLPSYLEGSQRHTERFIDKVLNALDSEASRDFLEQVKEEYTAILKCTGKQASPVGEDIAISLIQTPSTIFGHDKIKIYIDLKNGHKREFQGYELVNSKETSNAPAYIITNQLDRGAVYLALEKTLQKHYHINLKPESGACCKYERNEQLEKAKALWRSGYYDDAPLLIPNACVMSLVNKLHISEVATKYQVYEGKQDAKIDEKGVLNFLKQWLAVCEDKGQARILLEGILSILRNAIFIDRKFFATNMPQLFQKIENSNGNIPLIPLGAMSDSAKHMSYYLNDIKEEIPELRLEEDIKKVLAETERAPIVFFDDGAYSGRQLVSIFQEYMGVPKENRETRESHVEPLTQKEQNELKNRKIYILFLAFNASNETFIEEHMQELGLRVDIKYIHAMNKKLLEPPLQTIFETEEMRTCVKIHLREVGLQLMQNRKMEGAGYREGWDQERVEEAALGYNDAQQMVILKSSVPTYTVTAFWQEGNTKDFPWKPLFVRTDK